MTKARSSRADLIVSALAAYQLSRKEAAASAGRTGAAKTRRLIHLPSFALTLSTGQGLAGDPEKRETRAEESDEPKEPDEREEPDEA
jgi:hypothetical protein